MTTLVRHYLAHRRSLGYVLRTHDLLFDFARFANRTAPRQPITTALAVRWATSSPRATRPTQSARLSMVRSLARYCAVFNPATEIPQPRLLGPHCVRLRPHHFSKGQVPELIRRAAKLTTLFSALHPLTYETLIGLLACTGMRPGEALRLQIDDFDFRKGLLRIGPCKFSPERIIPLHSTTQCALRHYRDVRRCLFPCGGAFFVGGTGRPLCQRRVDRVFNRLAAGIPANGDRHSVRLLDFRHNFASQWIADWGRQAKPVSHHLLLLARYLGHRDFMSTWWYVSSAPATLQAAAQSFQQFHRTQSDEA